MRTDGVLEPVGDVTVRAIGHVSGPRVELVDDHWGNVSSVIRLDAGRFGPEALAGLDAFSHLEVVFHFHRVPAEAIETGARRPRGNPDRPLVGILTPGVLAGLLTRTLLRPGVDRAAVLRTALSEAREQLGTRRDLRRQRAARP
ncbi:hypothetical protein OG948_24200 [Embleya sp. NBC_00888]|uniref:hypothetical protein n=1 Tax=Embleya sp. NBC_00888 TaxID=2975960 RepID=UPI0038631AB8|nr:hypothetical protein OG948_24200 [Embleya sp. NBC_00888]